MPTLSMPTLSTQKFVIGAIFMLATATTQAAVVNVNFSYSGSTLFNMTGSFSYDANSVGNVVDKNELLSFQFDVFSKSNLTTPLYGYSLNVLSEIDNFFKFDALSQRFDTSPGSQRWGTGAFLFQITNPRSGIKGQGLIMNGSYQDLVLPENLAASLKYNVTTVPEPETYGMLGLGLGMIGAAVRRRKQA